MDINVLRDRLVRQHGRWGELAAMAGVNRKTIHRIVHRPGYMPNLQTFVDLEGALDRMCEAQAAPAAPKPEPADAERAA